MRVRAGCPAKIYVYISRILHGEARGRVWATIRLYTHTHTHICTHGRRCRSNKYVVKWASFLHFGARSVKTTTTTSAFDVFDNIASERVLNARTVHGRRRRRAPAHRVSTIYGLGDDYDDDDIYRN